MSKVRRVAFTVEFSVIPLGVSVSVSKFSAPAIEELERRAVKYDITPMCTVFEAENANRSIDIIRAAHDAVFGNNVERVVTTVKIDDWRDITRDMNEKVESLKTKIRR